MSLIVKILLTIAAIVIIAFIILFIRNVILYVDPEKDEAHKKFCEKYGTTYEKHHDADKFTAGFIMSVPIMIAVAVFAMWFGEPVNQVKPTEKQVNVYYDYETYKAYELETYQFNSYIGKKISKIETRDLNGNELKIYFHDGTNMIIGSYKDFYIRKYK